MTGTMMNMQWGIVALLLCASAQANANADAGTSIYKCTSGGKVTYSSTRCTSGSMAEMPVRSGPPSAARDAQRVQRQAKVAASMRRERMASEALERKQNAVTSTEQARVRRCARLQLAQKQADAKVDDAASGERDAMRIKARAHRDSMAIECPV